MARTFFLSALSVLAVSAVSAQSGQFYLDWDKTTKQCTVVTSKPTDKSIAGGGPFATRAEAEAAIKTVAGCSDKPMK